MPREDQDVVAHAITDLEIKALRCIQMLKRLNCHLTIIAATVHTNVGNFGG